jgi:glyoxylase-like metal-dependent hydrolase (beta-lactamase superfamily II)
MQVYTLANGPFMVNSYMVVNNDRGIVIDPGSGIGPLLDKAVSEGVTIEAIIATHGHIDHIDGVNMAKGKTGAPFYVSALDSPLVQNVQMQANMFGLPPVEAITAEKELPASGDIKIAGLDCALFYTPGHSKGSVSILIEDCLFSGDVLFNYSIGRTDLPGGDYAELIDSIRKNLFIMPDETRVLSGHGPETTIGTEKKHNPFLQ